MTTEELQSSPAAARQTLGELMDSMGRAATAAAQVLARASTEQKNRALRAGAAALLRELNQLLAANERDLRAAAASNMTGALIDRLRLDPARIAAMASGLEDIAALADPVNTVLAEW